MAALFEQSCLSHFGEGLFHFFFFFGPLVEWLGQGLAPDQGCQMAYFQTKNLNFGKFWSVL
jgi:hypothetical protein